MRRRDFLQGLTAALIPLAALKAAGEGLYTVQVRVDAPGQDWHNAASSISLDDIRRAKMRMEEWSQHEMVLLRKSEYDSHRRLIPHRDYIPVGVRIVPDKVGG